MTAMQLNVSLNMKKIIYIRKEGDNYAAKNYDFWFF